MLAACDASGPPSSEACKPAGAVDATYGRNASVAVLDDAGCRVEASSALAGSTEYPFGPERDYERLPTFLIDLDGPINDGVQVVFGLSGAEPPAVARYPITDLRGRDGTFGPLPARFDSGAFYSFTTNGDGQGWWFATGGEVIVERSDESGVAATFEATYLHGGGGRPLTLRGRFRAVPGQPNYGQFSNPHGG